MVVVAAAAEAEPASAMALQTASTPAQARFASATGLRSELRSSTVSLAAAGLAAGGVLAAGTGGPRLASLTAAAFLFLATHWDVRYLRIPNWLTFPAMALALAGHAAEAGASGAGFALAGIAAAFAALLLPYAAGLLGAGDVKASMALGALLGAPGILAVLIWSALLGGVFGCALLLATGGFCELLRRWATSLTASLETRRLVFLPAPPDAPAARVVPFALVLAFGVAAAFAWGTPWA